MITIVLKATLPDALLQPFLQAIRDFDMMHDPDHEGHVHVDMLTESDWPVEKMAEALGAMKPRPAYFEARKPD